ncbi:FUSC family protein [Cupriavidus necator]|uniref:FUSC family protein n=1 Tax=Cupriavidus necator TaxID=106590 RepID=UPI001490353E|nr:FUSC family protein [Cupriavidus necator]NOV23958.1 FUSC family protein [Cupriavidus necator]
MHAPTLRPGEEPATLARAAHACWQADAGRWLHAAKTALAVLMAMWLSMRLELSSPRTAMVSVVILMMHQHSGMVLARGFYRAAGMLVGNLAALMLFHAFPQERVLFFAALSIWIGLCVAGAAYYRNYQSYGFVLSGYATCIAAVPAISNPYGIFDSMVVSLSEVSVGILCAGLVSGLVFPQRVTAILLGAGQQHLTSFISFIRQAVHGGQAGNTLWLAHLRLTGERAQLENLRSATVFEDPEMRANNDLMIRLNHDFLDAVARFHGIHQLRARLIKVADHRAGDALRDLFERLLAILPAAEAGGRLSLAQVRALHGDLKTLRATLPAQIVSARTALDDTTPATRDRFAAGAILLDDGVADLLAFTGNYVALRTQRPPRAAPVTDERPEKLLNSANRAFALASGGRASIAILACSWLWIASGWNNGGSALISTTIAIALYSVMPQPTTVARHMLIGCLAAWIAGMVFNFAILPRLDGFPLLAVGLGPVILAGSYLGTFPATAIVGLGFGIYFCFLTNLANPALYNPVGYLDGGITTLLGIGMASLAFATIVPTGSAWLADRYLRQLRAMVAMRVCYGSLAGLRLTFESNIRDFVQYAGTRPASGSASRETLLNWSFAALEIGLAVIYIREAVERHVMPGPWQAQQDLLLAAVSALFQNPSLQMRERALNTVEQVIRETASTADGSGGNSGVLTAGPARVRAQLHVIRLSLIDDAFPLSGPPVQAAVEVA